ncbi:uncharacterized protein LOC144444555 isoform X2 [Glandiceps talaboti]
MHSIYPQQDDFNRKKLKAPSKKKLDDDVEMLMTTIRSKEDEFKCLQQRPQNEVVTEEGGERDSLQAQLKTAKTEKEAVLEKRKQLDEKLKVINTQIAKKVDVVKKMQAGLRYKTEVKINDAIRKFEYQLRVQNFRMAEEKRMVAEIDSLKRSKKCLREYLVKQGEIDAERKKQKSIKEERDHYFNAVAALKSKEDKVRQQLRNKKSIEDEAWTKYKESGQLRENLKKEIDDLYERKRRLVADFKRQHFEYHEKMKLERLELQRKKDEEKKLEREAQQREIEEYEASREPYEDEKVLISALIAYLHRSVNIDDVMGQTTGDSTGEDSPSCSPVSTLQMKEIKDTDGDFRILRRKSADDFDSMFASGSGKRKKSSKKQRRNTWMSKPVKHSPETIAQFAQLGISAPSHVGEIALVVEQLTSKKDYYENLPPRPRRMLSKVEEEERLQNLGSALQTENTVESGQFDDACESEISVNVTECNSGTTAQEVKDMTCQDQLDSSNLDNNVEGSDPGESIEKQNGAIETAERDSLNNVIKGIDNVTIDGPSANNNDNTNGTVSDGGLDEGDDGNTTTTTPEDNKVTHLQDFTKDNEECVRRRVEEMHELKRREALDNNDTFTDSIVNSYNLDNVMVTKDTCSSLRDKTHHSHPPQVSLQESL